MQVYDTKKALAQGCDNPDVPDQIRKFLSEIPEGKWVFFDGDEDYFITETLIDHTSTYGVVYEDVIRYTRFENESEGYGSYRLIKYGDKMVGFFCWGGTSLQAPLMHCIWQA